MCSGDVRCGSLFRLVMMILTRGEIYRLSLASITFVDLYLVWQEWTLKKCHTFSMETIYIMPHYACPTSTGLAHSQSECYSVATVNHIACLLCMSSAIYRTPADTGRG